MHDLYQVGFTRRARADLDGIYDYIAKDSLPNAAHFVAELVEAISRLQELPRRYPIYRIKRRSMGPIRRMPLGMYLVYYRVDEGQMRVEVITIRHGMRRQPQRFTGRN